MNLGKLISRLQSEDPNRGPACHWTGNSKDCDGGLPIADTGDYSELRCPRCESDEIEEACDEA